MLNKSCFPFDPAERIMTEISNLQQQGFNYRQIRLRVEPMLDHAWQKSAETLIWIHDSPLRVLRNMWRISAAYNGLYGTYYDGVWSDVMAELYLKRGSDKGWYYEETLYPAIKDRQDLFEVIMLMDRKEKYAYS